MNKVGETLIKKILLFYNTSNTTIQGRSLKQIAEVFKKNKKLTTRHTNFHNAKFDSWQTSVLLKFIEQTYDLDMKSEKVINKIFGWHPLCENVIDRKDPSKKLNFI